MEDLFLRIFDIDPEKRLNFMQLREHPIFAKYFTHDQEGAKLIYSQRIQVVNVEDESNIHLIKEVSSS
jgi:hypothetical protein